MGAIKTRFSPATIAHFIIGLMIFLWIWSGSTALNASIWVTGIAILKEIFDYLFKISILKWLLEQGFYSTGFGGFLAKNRFIMPASQVYKAKPLFDFNDIIATVAIPYVITILVLIFR